MEQIQIGETRKFRMKGEVFLKLGKNLTREEIVKNPDFHKHNIIVDVASEQIAEWAFTGIITLISQHVPGILTLAVGTGGAGWDLQNPPAPTAVQTLLENELARKQFSNVTYVDSLGDPTVTRTNKVEFTTTFLESEAVGPLVEMSLWGGNGALATDGGTMINYFTMPVVNKTSSSQLGISWLLTF